MSENDLVWNTITNSAKRRFDYKDFSEGFNDSNENVADNLLFKIIVGFVENKSSKIISLELFSSLMIHGLIWELKEIESFVEGKEKVFKIEIFATKIAIDLLQDGNNPESVVMAIGQLLQL